jgi:tellurite resistance protein
MRTYQKKKKKKKKKKLEAIVIPCCRCTAADNVNIDDKQRAMITE